jgi:hypothetical protein
MARSRYGSERPVGRGRRIAAFAAAVVVAVAMSANGLAAEIPVAGEYDIKAAFLVNFSKFIEWPEKALAGSGAPMVIGVVGADPFGPRLDAVAAGRRLDGHAIEIRRIADPRNVGGCHVVFVGVVDAAARAALLPSIAARGILTVGEAPGFLDQGGMIQFFVEDRRVRFAINTEIANAAGLKISSRLAQLATSPRSVRDVRE